MATPPSNARTGQNEIALIPFRNEGYFCQLLISNFILVNLIFLSDLSFHISQLASDHCSNPLAQPPHFFVLVTAGSLISFTALQTTHFHLCGLDLSAHCHLKPLCILSVKAFAGLGPLSERSPQICLLSVCHVIDETGWVCTLESPFPFLVIIYHSFHYMSSAFMNFAQFFVLVLIFLPYPPQIAGSPR